MARLRADAPLIHPDCTVVNATFGAYTEVGQGSRIQNTNFGDYAYCDRFADIANAEVGRFANIAAMTRIGPSDHPWRNAAQHHFLYRSASYFDDVEDDAEFFAHRASRRTVLGADCWIGHGAIVKPEVTVGIGAVVAAGAVVTKDVAPFMIVAGIPARPLRQRCPDGIAERLLALAWWDWDHARLRSALDDFRRLPAEAFLDAYEC
ncbi:chloramphenicol acetyltransferase [Defluviimonas aestuarii]|uniref:chloramphenicol acetyltransferase n=1 Tax=Albidovulum aestuarii TaxID=1130726 RepID=UPI00249C7D43|nr:chloramphenicol acetyltransferase [Defluviimonas aestuarii]MDI3337872.1 chloramphenicol acetyltransferase [Defluviimonas aestuarii]